MKDQECIANVFVKHCGPAEYEWLYTEEEMNRRRADWRPPAPRFERGYGKLYVDHVLQADQGCDFDFCRGKGL